MENPKRRKTCKLNYKNPKLPKLSIESLPNEIFMNIFSHLNIKDLLKCGLVNKKFRQISHDKSFWKCVNLYNQNVSCELIGHILSLGTEYLNLQGTILYIDHDTAGKVIPRKNNLKYLNLAFSSVRDRFLVRLLRSSVALEKISLREVNQNRVRTNWTTSVDPDQIKLKLRRSWFIECLLPNAKLLTTLDLSNDQGGLTLKLDPESMEEILLNCTELKEANFKNQIKDVDFFVNNLTPKIEKLNISYNNGFLCEHVVQLVKRCKSISELDLKECWLYIDGYDFDGEPDENQNYLLAISENLSQSLIKLQLPGGINIYHIVYRRFLNSLPKLRYLWTRNCKDSYDDIMKEYLSSSIRERIVLNEGTAKIASCSSEYFEPDQGFWELKCTAVDLSKTQ